MSRRNSTDRTGRSKKAPRHVRLYYWMMETAAWRSLNATQRAILIELLARYDGSNNGRIPYSVRDAAETLRIGKATAARALVILQVRGFIVPVSKGAFSLKVRHATTWRLSEFPDDVRHELATKDFARWSPIIQNTVSPRAGAVAPVKPNGTCDETVTAKNSADGTSGETAAPDSADSRSHQRYINKLPGIGAVGSALAVEATPNLENSTDLGIPKFLKR